MPIWLHILLDTVISFAGIALWWTLAIVLGLFDALDRLIPQREICTTLFFLVLTAGIGFGMLCSRWFRRIPARCKECGGKAFAQGNRPLRYLCQDCGFLLITRGWCNRGRE